MQMDIITFFIDIIKYIVAGSVVVAVANWLFWPQYNSRALRLKSLDMARDVKKEVLPLRLQAYERVVLLVERINPAHLLVRLHQPSLSALDFQHILLNEIRSEYQHNITQQLYVSDLAWSVTKQLKDNTVALIRNTMSTLPATASAKEFNALLLTHIAEMEENPYDLALRTIKNELPG